MLILLFLFILFNVYISNSYNPLLILGGSCTKVKDDIYYLGGRSGLNKSSYSPNKAIYKVQLNHNITLKSSKLEWQKVYENENTLENLYLKLFYDGTKLISIGGQADTTSINYFDIKNNQWIFNKKASNGFIKAAINKTTEDEFYTSSFSIAQNNNQYEFVLIGGLYFIPPMPEDSIAAIKNVLLFNSKQDTWKKLDIKIPHSINAISFFYKNDLYTLGGTDIDNQPNKMDSIIKININTLTIEQIPLTGDIPSNSDIDNYIINSNTLYLINEYSNTTYPSKIYTLNLNNFKFTSYQVTGFESGIMSCLIYYNNYLIYSFGGYKTSNYFTQIIDTKNWKKVDNLKGEKENKVVKEEIKKQDNSINLSALISSIVIITLLIIIILYLIYRYKIKQHQQLDKKDKCPYLLVQPQLIDFPLTLDNKSVKFRHSGLSNKLDSTVFLLPYTYTPF